MTKTKLRKQGNSIVVTIPAKESENLEIEQEYYVHTDENGAITLIPVITDPYKDTEFGEFYDEEIWKETKSVGKELW